MLMGIYGNPSSCVVWLDAALRACTVDGHCDISRLTFILLLALPFGC